MLGQHRITPRSVLDVVERVHPIHLDPCSNTAALTCARVQWRGPTFGCLDGLEQPWRNAVSRNGMAWVNPPWERPFDWAVKCAEEWHEQGVRSMLWVPCYPETATADMMWQHASALAFWRRRVHHPTPVARAKGGSMWPMWLAYFGPAVNRLCDVLAPEHARIAMVWTR